MKPTKKMAEFMAHNEKTRVVSAEALTPEGKPIQTATDAKRADRIRYRFADGSQRTLRYEDARSALHFLPEWDFRA